MEFRRATSADIGSLNKIMHSSSAYDGKYYAILDGYEISKEQLENDLVYLAVDSNEILGFYSIIINEPELDLMFVSDRAQGRGVGKALFNQMIGLLKEKNITDLKIVSHPPAAGFYKRMGARQTGTAKGKGRVTWDRPILKLDLEDAA